MMRESNDARSSREGFTLVEIAMAILVFTLLSLPVTITLVRGMEHRRNSFQQYRGLSALRDIAAEIQDTANRPQNLQAQEGLGAVYSKYHNKTFTVPDLPGGTLEVECFANEMSVPAELGGPQDLNFDGDAQDNLGNQSNGTDLRLIPLTLSVSFTEGTVTYRLTSYYLITKTSM